MKKQIQPDITAELQFYSTAEGGLKKPIFLPKIGCLFTHNGEMFNCYLLLPKGSKVFPGEKKILPIKFLYSDLIKPHLKVGDNFTLSDYKVFAEGKIIEIISA